MTDNKRKLNKELTELLGSENVLIDEPMKNHCSFRSGGPADLFLKITDPGKMAEALKLLKLYDTEYFLLGRGTNILVSDEGYRGAIVTMNGLYDEISVDPKQGTLRACAGASLAAIAGAARDNGLTGLEFAAGIPGSLGGALVMNAGAYGGEICQVLKEALLLFPDGSVRSLSCEEMELGYRTSILKRNGACALEAEFTLEKGDASQIGAKMEDLAQRRREKQPLEYPSAGSTFKRPEGYFAGKLIQDAGLAGYSVGGAQVSEKHCGFVINRSGASSSQIRQVIADVQRIVEEKSGVRLEPEVIFLGF